jgi:hypothetical protein
MYREDLDQLLELFRGKCNRVTISDRRFRYESFDEMKAHTGPRIDHLEIHGEQPGLHFLLNQSQEMKTGSTNSTIIFNELRAEEATEEADALFFRIKDFLNTHQQPHIRWRFIVLAIAALVGLVLFVSLNRLVGPPPDNLVPWPPAVAVLGLVAALIGGVILATNIRNYLTLETRLNSPSFWARHQDAFATHAVTATISAVVGWLAGHFLK